MGETFYVIELLIAKREFSPKPYHTTSIPVYDLAAPFPPRMPCSIITRGVGTALPIWQRSCIAQSSGKNKWAILKLPYMGVFENTASAHRPRLSSMTKAHGIKKKPPKREPIGWSQSRNRGKKKNVVEHGFFKGITRSWTKNALIDPQRP